MNKRSKLLVYVFIVMALVLGACSPAAAPTDAATTEAAATEAVATEAVATEAAATEAATSGTEPTTLKIAILATTTAEEPWNTALLQAMDRVIAAKPHGLTISYTFQENIDTPDGERVFGELASTGEYGIIWGDSVYPDAIAAVAPQYPDMAFVGAGSGYDVTQMGENRYLVDVRIQEAAYLNGIIAGKMTKSNVIGAVASYPYTNVNAPLNGFIAGAKSVNPDVKVKMNYINSWYDPAKAKEAALSEIAAGADYIYAERFGPFEATSEKGVFAFGQYVDQNALAPETVVSSTLALWDPCINAIIDAWWNHQVNGTPYNASNESALYFLMKDGGSDIAPFHNFDSIIPQDVKDLVAATKADIISGKLVVEENGNEVKGD